MARAKSIGNVYAELSVRDEMSKGLEAVKKRLSNLKAVGIATFGALAAGSAYFLKKSVDSASDFGETTSKSSVIFAENAKAMERWAENAAGAFGQSKKAALESAATIGNMFTAMGLDSGKTAEMSKNMVQLAGDLASFNNTTPEDAVQALSAALRGESEPIRRYGVLLNEATLKAKALEMGLYNGKGALDPATKALAAYQVILNQTKTAQGDFARTSDGLANSQRILAAKWEDMKVALGQSLLPVVESLFAQIKSLDLIAIGNGISALIGPVGQLTAMLLKIPIQGLSDLASVVVGSSAANDAALGSRRVQLELAARRANMLDMQGIGGAASGIDKGSINQFLIEDEKKRAETEKRIAELRAKEHKKAIARLDELAAIEQERRAEIDEANRIAAEDFAQQMRDRDIAALGEFDGLESAVNSMQARGLGMGAVSVPKEIKDQVSLLKAIHETLKKQLKQEEPGAVF